VKVGERGGERGGRTEGQQNWKVAEYCGDLHLSAGF